MEIYKSSYIIKKCLDYSKSALMSTTVRSTLLQVIRNPLCQNLAWTTESGISSACFGVKFRLCMILTFPSYLSRLIESDLRSFRVPLISMVWLPRVVRNQMLISIYFRECTGENHRVHVFPYNHTLFQCLHLLGSRLKQGSLRHRNCRTMVYLRLMCSQLSQH